LVGLFSFLVQKKENNLLVSTPWEFPPSTNKNDSFLFLFVCFFFVLVPKLKMEAVCRRVVSLPSFFLLLLLVLVLGPASPHGKFLEPTRSNPGKCFWKIYHQRDMEFLVRIEKEM
jgi:hypothetical protein